MSGHSKWAGIKHKKALVDAKRGKEFGKFSRAITVAAREGGGDPEHNAALATAIQKAKDANMPNDNIDRAVKKGTGESADAAAYMHLTYEGYGPNGVAVYVMVLTDNKNRSAADVRHIFDRSGGNLGTDGSVSWMFERKGVVYVDAAGRDEDEVMMVAIEAGAEDMIVDGDSLEIRTEPFDFMAVRHALEAAGIPVASAQLTMIPKNTVALDEADAKKTFRLLDALEDNDDVQEVFANFDITDEVMEALAG
ncbi:MAG TPA: YebC/PmpR family DNA-binding transcriptional regulator [Thermoleophilia bacterium]|nr:YebC/PmpR family DNA-binding transcriptional regulator [Thermoleophilia bacterium]HZK48218.1 YebC/PmpR family DNA-binding transcriptional regulator [Thermoleophilia bacterium]